MGILRVVRIIVHILAILTTLIAIGFTAGAILTTGWQIMTEPGSGEVHQHGLWLDYNRVHPHVAGASHGPNIDDPNGWQWIFKYKFGDAVKGDEVHRAEPYQENTLILLAVSMGFAVIGAFLSYCAGLKVFIGIIWAVCMLISVILSAAGLILFYVAAMQPMHRYVSTDRKIEQVIGYSFWYGVVGAVGFALAMLESIVCIILLILSGRRGEKTEKAAFTFKSGNNTRV